MFTLVIKALKRRSNLITNGNKVALPEEARYEIAFRGNMLYNGAVQEA